MQPGLRGPTQFKVCPQYMNPECVKADQWEGEILVDLRNVRVSPVPLTSPYGALTTHRV